MKIGKAYAFFYYSGNTSDILNILPNIRESEEIPSEVTVNLEEIAAFRDEDSALTQVIEKAREEDMSHVLKATMQGLGHRRVAELTGDLCNGIYLSLYQKGDQLRAGIVYKRGKSFVFRRK